MIVYKITNQVNDKIYIGQIRYSLAHRWSAHCRLKSHCSALAGAIQKYGRQSFIKEIVIDSICPVVITYQEQKLIRELHTIAPNGYNLTIGGEGAAHTEQAKRKLSEGRMGAKNPMYGKKLSPEHRAKIGAAFKGKKLTQAHKDKLSTNHNPKSNLNLTYRRKPNTIKEV